MGSVVTESNGGGAGKSGPKGERRVGWVVMSDRNKHVGDYEWQGICDVEAKSLRKRVDAIVAEQVFGVMGGTTVVRRG